MQIVEQTQKDVLLNQAARTSILNSDLRNLQQILSSLIGPTDVGQQVWNQPLTPVYLAIENSPINMGRISNYFTGLARDLQVTDISLTQLENDISNLNLEFWTRIQLATNKANLLQQRINQANQNLTNTSTWSYTETFFNTNNIDVPDSTVQIDTGQGTISIPSNSSNVVVPGLFTFTSQTVPQGGSFLNSNPSYAFDGQFNTSWMCLFTQPGFAVSEISTQSGTYVSTLTVTPLNQINLLVDIDTGNGYINYINANVTSKTTYIVNVNSINNIRVSFQPINSSYPVACGISEIIMYSNNSLQSAQLESVIFEPSSPFTTLQVDYSGTVLGQSDVNVYYNITGSGGSWNLIQPGTWTNIGTTLNNTLNINPTQATNSPVYRGLYGIGIGTASQPLSTSEGSMQVGLNQMQVDAFFQDWRSTGQVPKILGPTDFTNKIAGTTWSGVDSQAINSDQFIIQQVGQTEISGNSLLNGGGQFLWFQRPITYTPNSPSDAVYQQLCIVPLQNTLLNSLQYSYNYKFSFQVFTPLPFNYPDAKYWFTQGYRQAGSVPYRSLNKSYMGFSIYINGILVAGSNIPDTIYSDNTYDVSAFIGTTFPLIFNQGWNTVEIYLNVVNPNVFNSDGLDSKYPYVQLCMTPSLFDTNFQNTVGYQITNIDGSGSRAPLSEFDLLWNAPKSPFNWAWSTDKQSVLFNVGSVSEIDGYYQGAVPNCVLTYQGLNLDAASSVQVKLGLESNNQLTGPIINQYQISTR